MKKGACVIIFGEIIPVAKKEWLREDMEADAYFDDRTLEIFIEEELDEEQAMKALIHEVGHAMFNRIGFSQGISKDLEETIVEAYSTMIVENFNITLK